ncbi:MAG TPA: DNA polymerase III subunit delta [Gammaproteobacteria bacterium]|jgi:DNA polymerase-3 subunit delta
MRLKPEQLDRHLKQPALSPIYFITGDEPLQATETCDAIRARARALGYTERVLLEVSRDFDWALLKQAGANLSLFSERRIVELRLGDHSPGKEGAAALGDYAAAAPPDNLLLISAGKFDGRSKQTKWFKALESAGVVIELWPVAADRLPEWLMQRMRRAGKNIDAAAAEFVALRVEGNLLAASQELDKLGLLVEGESIGIEDVLRSVSDSARFDAFALVDASLLGEKERVVRTLRGLRAEGHELPMVIGAVLWQLRLTCAAATAVAAGASIDRALNAARAWGDSEARARAALKRHRPDVLISFLRDAAAADRAAKGALKADPWRLLEEFLLRVAGLSLGVRPA